MALEGSERFFVFGIERLRSIFYKNCEDTVDLSLEEFCLKQLVALFLACQSIAI